MFCFVGFVWEFGVVWLVVLFCFVFVVFNEVRIFLFGGLFCRLLGFSFSLKYCDSFILRIVIIDHLAAIAVVVVYSDDSSNNNKEDF